MSEEIKKLHIKTYDEWLKYYKNATKEQVIKDLTRDVQYFADAVKDIKDLQQKVEQLKKENKELNRMCELYSQSLYNADLTKAEDEIERLNNIINRIDNFIDRTIEVIKQQPTSNDEWILERLNGIKYLSELKENK